MTVAPKAQGKKKLIAPKAPSRLSVRDVIQAFKQSSAGAQASEHESSTP